MSNLIVKELSTRYTDTHCILDVEAVDETNGSTENLVFEFFLPPDGRHVEFVPHPQFGDGIIVVCARAMIVFRLDDSVEEIKREWGKQLMFRFL